MTMAAAMDGMVTLLGTLPTVEHSVKAAEPDFAAGHVTAVVTYDSVELDADHNEAYVVNFGGRLVATAETEATALDALAAAVHDLARLWWSDRAQDLGGAARQFSWGGVDEFVTVAADDGRVMMTAAFSARAVVPI